MPNYLIALGSLALVIVTMGLISVTSVISVISVIGGSWIWSVVTWCSIVLWFGLAALVPEWVHRPEDSRTTELVGVLVKRTRGTTEQSQSVDDGVMENTLDEPGVAARIRVS